MRKILPSAALFVASAACFADDVAPKEGEWIADFDTAAAAAKAQKKDLLVDFTGSDWCGWCIKLHKEVFEQPEFRDAAGKSFVLVALDFPRGEAAKAKVPNADRNKELAQKYEVDSYPTVLVLTPEGEVLAHGGYSGAEKGAKYWFDKMSSAAAATRDVPELEKAWSDATTDAARTTAAGKAAERLEGAGDRASDRTAERLAVVARHGIELDPENKSGVKARVLKALFGAGLGSDAEIEAAKKLDPKNASGLLEWAVFARMAKAMRGDGAAEYVADARALAAGDLKDPDVYVPALANACVVAKQQANDAAAAKEIAETLKKKRPDDERLQKFLGQFLKEETK